MIALVALAGLISLSGKLGYGQQTPIVFVPEPVLTPAERLNHPTALEVANWGNTHNFGLSHVIIVLCACLIAAIAVTAIQAGFRRRRTTAFVA